MEPKLPRLVSGALMTPGWNALYISFEGGLTMLAPADCHMAAKVGPAARTFMPFNSAGFVMQLSFEARPPANQASERTITPCFAISARISFMNCEALMRFARSWLRIKPGIRVALNTGTLPLA